MTGLMDMGETVAAFGTDTYTVTRKARGTTSGGIAVFTSATLSIVASVQPATPEQVERMSEGTRLDGAKVVYTATVLRSNDETTGSPADRISIDSATYEVEQVSDYQALGGFHEVLVRRVDPV